MSATQVMQVDDFQVRGYMIANVAGYLRDLVGEAEAKRMIDGMSPKNREIVLSTKSAVWSPVGALSELLNTIASNANGNDDEAQRLLINCGKYMAREATNTFLRLLMRMLTPALFAKKLPDLWSRDCNRGKLVVEMSDEKLLCKVFETAGFDHAVCTACGFVSFALETMGKKVEQTTLRDWSLKSPSKNGASFELVWSK
jgi:hypothetical protein